MPDSTIGCSWNWCSIFIVHLGCKVQTTDFKSPPLIYKEQDLIVCKGKILIDFYPVLWLINENSYVFSSLIYNPETILVLYNSQDKTDDIKNDK